MRPSARTSNWDLLPGMGLVSIPSFRVISAARLAARVS